MDYIVNEKNGEAIQKAIDEAANNGGGRVVLLPGTYLSRTLYLKSNIELHLSAGAVLLGYPKPDFYDDFCEAPFAAVAPEGSRKCLIAGSCCENIAVTGFGEINGQGVEFYDRNVPAGTPFAKPPHPRPRLLQLYNCRNVHIQNVSLLESPGWTIWLIKCENVHISGITISGCQQMVNNDGIDIDGCRRVTVSDSTFRTGDDCIILRAIRHTPDETAVCEHITVTNCIFNSRCQGIRIGCPSDDTIRHCTFSNIVFQGDGNGMICEAPHRYLRRNCTGFLQVTDMNFNNLDIECKRHPVQLNCEDALAIRGLKRWKFSNIRVKSGLPFFICGSQCAPIEDISLSNISGTVAYETPLVTKYVRNLKFDNVDLTAVEGEVVPFVRKEFPSWETKF